MQCSCQRILWSMSSNDGQATFEDEIMVLLALLFVVSENQIERKCTPRTIFTSCSNQEGINNSLKC